MEVKPDCVTVSPCVWGRENPGRIHCFTADNSTVDFTKTKWLIETFSFIQTASSLFPYTFTDKPSILFLPFYLKWETFSSLETCIFIPVTSYLVRKGSQVETNMKCLTYCWGSELICRVVLKALLRMCIPLRTF